MKKHILFFILFFLIIQSAYSGWHSVMKGLQGMGGAYTAIAAKGDTLYAASGRRDKIYISTDKGKNWKATASPIAIWIINIIIQDSIVFACGDEAVYYTKNNGDTWSTYLNMGSGEITAFMIKDNNWYIGYADSWSGEFIWTGILVSDDNGKNWKKIELDSILITCFKARGDSVYAGTTNGIYLSIDNGEKWEYRGIDSIDVRSIAIKDNIVLAGSYKDGIYKSSDNGISWQKTGLDTQVVSVIEIKDEYILAGTDFGIYISRDNGASWEETGFMNAQVSSIAIDGDNIYAVTFTINYDKPTKYGIYVSTDNGKKWKIIGIKGGSEVRFVAIKDSTVYAGGSSIDLVLSKDNGNSWQNSGLTRDMSGGVSTIAFDNEKIFAGCNYGLFLSTDEGNTWERRFSETTFNPSPTSLVIKGDSIFAGVSFGFGGVYLTTDFGQTWKSVFMPIYVFSLGVKGDSILMGKWKGLYLLRTTQQNIDSGEGYWKRLISDPSIRCIKADDKSIFAAGDSGLYKTTDEGISWKRIEEMGKIQAIAIDRNNIVVGGRNEVYLSTDYGITWEKTGLEDPYRTPLSGGYVNSLAINADTIFAATYSGLYRYIIGDTSTVEDTIDTHIVQTATIPHPVIFPNPARDYIYFNSKFFDGSGMWQYQIYDILGNCVQSGTIETNKINISGLSSGFYTVRFFSGGKQVVEKLMKE